MLGIYCWNRSIRYLSTTVRNGSVVVFEDKKIKGGRDFWTYLNEEKAQAEQFNRAMTAMNTIMAPALAADGPFKDKKVRKGALPSA